jgi:hypothetical protein
MRKVFLTALMALSFVSTPVLAAAVPVVTPLTQPASETVAGDNALVGGNYLLLILALVALGGGIAAAASSGDRPNSP